MSSAQDVFSAMEYVLIDATTYSAQTPITQAEYQNFKRYWIMDCLAGYRYGQAFCQRYGISNASPLYYFKDDKISERWIRDNYIK